jgi:ribulose-phosphate 3-epimerase
MVKSQHSLGRRGQVLEGLRRAAPTVLPSMLKCDFGNLEREVSRLEAAGIAGFHLDVMDGRFVPNLTYGMPIVEAFRRLTSLPLDVHLMIEEPGRYVQAFVDAGADVITIHAEAEVEPGPVLERIRRLGAAAGLAINPDTPVSAAEPWLGSCDLLLVMSVPPGFGGQDFDAGALKKLQFLRSKFGDSVLWEIDGGVAPETIEDCARAGADLFVVGSAIFSCDDYVQAIDRLSRLAREGRAVATF